MIEHHSQYLVPWALPVTMDWEEPKGWPGVIHREGRTLVRVSERPNSQMTGPVSRRGGGVFLNPAMSGRSCDRKRDSRRRDGICIGRTGCRRYTGKEMAE